MEDKKCRICGFADMANPSIFNSNSKLVEKIVAVFPIVLYPNDPLPKHICKKCLISTQSMYADIERALRNQNKWICNVRAVQPDNHYVKVVDCIESAIKETAEMVTKVTGDEIGERTLCHMFNIKFDNPPNTNNVQNNVCKHESQQQPTSVRMEQDTVATATMSSEHPMREQSVQTVLTKPPNKNPTKITHLTSVLELNGCTLTKLKPNSKPQPETKELDPEPNQLDEIKVEIKEEPLFHDEYSEYSVNCKMCSFTCETVEELAIHQLDHLSLSLPKLSERRFLDKRIRRGRLIRIAEKKCIRCLNCWRIFVDNKSILHHWSTGDCDFFCQICGKDFASSPRMLREHVPAAHGISYRSIKLLRPHTFAAKSVHIKKEQSPQKSELSPNKGVRAAPTQNLALLSEKVACNICMKVFANFKARNSHMRAHKNPPLLPAQPPPSLSDTLLAFNRTELLPVKEEPCDYDDIPYHIVQPLDGLGPSTSKVVRPPHCGPNTALQPIIHPSPRAISHRPQKPLFRSANATGVRTKYVQIRPSMNSIVFKSELSASSSHVLKVKSLIDLQDPSVTSQQPESLNSGNGSLISNGLGNPTQSPTDKMNYAQIFNCHPCGGKFSSKLELFRHKRKCTANNLYPCQFCARHFLTSADLQMHIMLLHKGNNAQ